MKRKIVNLSEEQTQVHCPLGTQSVALNAAFLVTLSPHEWVWSLTEQQAMAQYCLWAHQKLSAIRQVVDADLTHPVTEKETSSIPPDLRDEAW